MLFEFICVDDCDCIGSVWFELVIATGFTSGTFAHGLICTTGDVWTGSVFFTTSDSFVF